MRVDYNGLEIPENCPDCGAPIPLQVCMSAAGYYAGSICPNCGPYSRESGYFRTRQQAQLEVDFLKKIHEADAVLGR